MGKQNFSTLKLEAKLSGTWVDITSYHRGSLSASWGMASNHPLDRTAKTGVMDFALKNNQRKFSPGLSTCLSGWQKGVEVLFTATYGGKTRKWLGVVDSIEPMLGYGGEQVVNVVVTDWLNYAAKTPIVNPGILANVRGDEVLHEITSLSPVPPKLKTFATGSETFPTALDTVTSKTKVYEEAIRISLSEAGYVYLKKDGENGEELVFEANGDRNGLRTPSLIPISDDSSGRLLLQGSGYQLLQGGGKRILNQTTNFSITSDYMPDAEVSYGNDVINRLTAYANPRRLDASPQVLFQLDKPIIIASGQTVEIKGTYADPAGGNPINAQDMITPVVTTDYLVNTAEDGSGTNISASLSLVSVVYGTEGFTHRVKNTSASSGYIIQYNTRGTGVYQYNQIQHLEKSETSITTNGHQNESLNQAYQSTLVSGTVEAKKIVEEYKDPKIIVDSISFCANVSEAQMMAAISLDVGDVVDVSISQLEISNAWYYIQGVEYEIKDGILMCKWILKLLESILSGGLTPVAVEFRGDSSDDGVDFGYIPYITNLDVREFTFWIDPDVIPTGTSDHIVCLTDDDNGVLISLTTDGAIQYYSKRSSNLGIWKTPANSISTTGLHFVTVSMVQADVSSDPVVHINNVLQTLTETATPSGNLKREDGVSLILGNWNIFTRAFDGRILDSRIYNRITTSAEKTALYNGGTPDYDVVTDGLLFQAFAVRTRKLSQYTDVSLTEELKLLDNIRGVVGTPHDAPIARTP